MDQGPYQKKPGGHGHSFRQLEIPVQKKKKQQKTVGK